MKVHIDAESQVVSLEKDFPLEYGRSTIFSLANHEELAKYIMAGSDYKNVPTRYIPTMIIIESEYLADDLRADPEHMHITNDVVCSKAELEARNELANKYMGRDDLNEFIDYHEMYLWKYNWKEQPSNERVFKHTVEDSIFKFQEKLALVDIIENLLETSKLVLDEDLCPIISEGEDIDETVVELDPERVQLNRRLLLEEYLKPRVHSFYERVYHMPEPFNHWDSRSYWHQFFILEDTVEDRTLVFRGNGGSSGSRETNGRMAHTFAQLTREYGLAIPTYHLCYDSRNMLKHIASYETFKCLTYDLVGNYPGSYKDVDILFDGMIITTRRSVRYALEAKEKLDAEVEENF